MTKKYYFCAWMKKNGDTKRVDGSMEQKGSVGSVFFRIIISISFHVVRRKIIKLWSSSAWGNSRLDVIKKAQIEGK